MVAIDLSDIVSHKENFPPDDHDDYKAVFIESIEGYEIARLPNGRLIGSFGFESIKNK